MTRENDGAVLSFSLAMIIIQGDTALIRIYSVSCYKQFEVTININLLYIFLYFIFLLLRLSVHTLGWSLLLIYLENVFFFLPVTRQPIHF